MATSKGTLSSEVTRYKNLIPILICLSLAILTVMAFSPIKDSGFISFDDDIFVYENAYVQSGLNWNSIRQAFSTELLEKAGWVPLTWLSLMLDSSIFGLNPSGYHLTNLLLHVINAILLFLILRRMTKTLWPSAFVACLFAIHPLHVESVAWIAERRDVLSTFFWMLTLGAYSYYVEQRNLKRYAFVLLFFILGLMAKPMLVTLPFVLLLLDCWPLGRFSEGKLAPRLQAVAVTPEVSDRKKKKSQKKDTEKETAKQTLIIPKPAEPVFQWSLIHPLLWEKIPIFALAILSSGLTYITAQNVGFIHSEAIPLDVRIGNAFISYVAYIGQMIWPVNLAVFYPHPENLLLWQVLGAIVILAVITFFVIWRVKKSPYLATGWLWYVGMLVPVIGIVQLGSQARADRYTYIPLIGLFIIIAWGVPDLLKKWSYRREILLALSALIILGLSIKTWTQVGYWQNSMILYDHTLKVTDHNWLIYNNRGATYSGLGNYKQAIEDLNRAIEIDPDYAWAYYNRGNAYKGLGNYNQAIEDYGRAIEIDPDYADAYINRGNAYNDLGNYKQAIEDYDRGIENKPGLAEAYYNRGVAYNGLGNYKQAIENFGRAIEIKPGLAEAYTDRGNAYKALSNHKQAIEDYNKAILLKANSAITYYDSGTLYAKHGQYQLAIEDFNKAIRLNPDHIKSYNNRGITYVQMGIYQKALEDFNEAIRLKSDYADAYNNRAFVYLKQGNNISGCRDAREACKLGNCKTLEAVKGRGLCH